MLRTGGSLKIAVIIMLVLGVSVLTVGCKKNKKSEIGANGQDEIVITSQGDGMGGDEYGEGTDSIDMEELPDRVEGTGAQPGEYGAATSGGRELLDVIYFDFDRADLRQDMMDELENNAAWILEHPDYVVLIAGHCDERGSTEYNIGLGQRRADAVLKFMLEQGIPLERLNTISYGEEMPAVDGKTPEAYAKNRRVEFTVQRDPGA